MNKHFQNTLGISKARSSGLQAAFFGRYQSVITLVRSLVECSRGLSSRLARPRELDPSTFRLQSRLHLGPLSVWHRCLDRLAMPPSPIIWRLLCCHLRYRQRPGVLGDCCESIPSGHVSPFSIEFIAVESKHQRNKVCGSPCYSEIRINLAQAFNAVGTVIAPVLGSYVFFENVGDNGSSLQNVQWVYLAIACFVFLLAVVFYSPTIPEITDADMMFQVSLEMACTMS